jgi:hypothetical protein
MRSLQSLCLKRRITNHHPPHVQTSTGFNMGVVVLTWGRWLYHGVGGFNKG